MDEKNHFLSLSFILQMYSLFVGVRELHAEAMLGEESVTSQRYLNVARMRYGTSQKH